MDNVKVSGHEAQPGTPGIADRQTAQPGSVAPQSRRRHRKHRRGGVFRAARHVRRRLKRVNWLLFAAIGIGLSAAAIMGGLVLIINAQNQVEDAWGDLERDWTTIGDTPMTELTLEDFDRLQARVGDLNNSLSSAEQKTLFLRPFTFLNADLDTTLKSLDASQELILAADNLLTGLQPTIFFAAGSDDSETLSPQFSSGARLVELTTLGQSRFRAAQRHLNAAETIIDRIELANVSPDVLTTFDGLAKHHAQLAEINDVLLDAPALLDNALGISEPRTYLVLSQNNDELRPSGGYLSTYGWIRVDRGRVVRYDYYPSSSTNPNPPDGPMPDDIDVPDWWIPFREPKYAMWDGSWTPNFPTSAQMAAWYYEQGNNPQAPVDGVIAIDIVGFEYILEGLEQVVVPSYNETVVSENFRDVIYRIRAEGEGDRPHKQFLVALFKQIFDDWQRADPARSGDIRRALLRALQEKHVMIYMDDPSLNTALDTLGWSGALEAGADTDYLMIADTNLGSKSNRSVIRQLTYDANIQRDGTIASRVAINYDYFARVAENDPAVKPEHYSSIDYHNLLQVFVPPGSELTDSNGFPTDPTKDARESYTEFVSYLTVDYDTSERYQLTYTTPALVEAFGPYRRYTLTLEKQPGTIDDFAIVQVTLPPGAKVISSSPQASATFRLESAILEFRLELVTDETIEIVYRQ